MDILFIISVVFFERKDPSATLARVMALMIFPGLGFILYLFLGQSFSKQKMFRIKKVEDQKLQGVIQSQISQLTRKGISTTAGDRLSERLQSMILMLLQNNDAFLTSNNRVSRGETFPAAGIVAAILESVQAFTGTAPNRTTSR